jgi:polyphosphate kinase
LFNWLTGVSVFPQLNKMKAAPNALHDFVIAMIEREAEHAKAGRPAGIYAKFNALVDPEVIQALYAASQAGVNIRLMVRGMCCLRSRIPGVSERITVRSIVGRFLEHSRVFRFENGGQPEIYLASADWMPRNFFRRVETCFPVEEPSLKEQLEHILEIYWRDNVKARQQAKGLTYERLVADPHGERLDAQAYFLDQITRRKRPDLEAKPLVIKPASRPREVEAEVSQPA